MQSYDDTCPYCDSMNIRLGDMIKDEVVSNVPKGKDLPGSYITKTVKVFCRDCGESWIDLAESIGEIE